MTKNVADSLIRKNIVKGDYQPVSVISGSSVVDIIAPLDKRSSACSIVRSRGNDTNKPRFVIIHGTTPGIKDSTKLSSQEAYLTSLCVNQGTTWKYFNKNYDKPVSKKGGSGHYTIFKDGMIAQHINEKDPVKQCEAYNTKSIGIEHHFIFGREPPTEQMYKASAKLVRDIIKRYGMLNEGKLKYEDVVLPHDPKYDPGPYWDWGYFLKLLNDPNHSGTPRSKGETEANLGTDWQDPSLPSPSYGPRKRVRPSMALPFYRGDIAEITDDEIENGILPFFIDNLKPRNRKQSLPFFRFDVDRYTPQLNNWLFGKKIENYKEYASLTNIELSNFVPFVELFLLKENQENMYPFDDYTSRANIENIFKDKTGRGGAVGIKSVSFKSLATNQSNLAQQTVKISFLIQDIQEIETVRNGVSLLDFLYPAGSREPFEYNRNNFNVKMKVGWKYKKNSLTSRVDDKIEKDMLEEVMYLSLFKHSFEFNEKDGTVTLDVEYIGMLEAELDDTIKTNVIQDLKFVQKEDEENKWRSTLNHFRGWDKKSEIQKSPAYYHHAMIASPSQATGAVNTVIGLVKQAFNSNAKSVIYNLEGEDSYTGSVEKGLSKEDITEITKKIEEKIESLAQTASRKQEIGYTGLIMQLFTQNGMNFIHIPKEDLEFIKSLSASNTSTSTSEIKKVKEIGQKSIKFLENGLNRKDQMAKMESGLREYQQSLEGTAWRGNREKVDIKEILTIMRNEGTKGSATDDKKETKDDLFVPYTFLGDILYVFYSKIYGTIARPTDTNDLRIASGQFSYSMLPENISSRPQNEQGGSTSKQQTVMVNQDGAEILNLTPVRRYKNILDIPITLKSFDAWYRSTIIDTEVKNMSFHEFVKKMMFELVPQNLEPKIIPWAPEIDFTPLMKTETVVRNKEDEKLLRTVQNPNYIYFTDPKFSSSNPFLNFYKRRENKSSKENEKVNYLFMFSKNEKSSTLRGDVGEDAKNNILHLYIGEETGLVKNIKFAREDNKQLDAANIVLANKTQGKPGIIRQIYQLKLDMFGNTIFSPGTLLHVTPTYPGSRLPNSTLYKIGLGGYYFVTQVTSRIEDNNFTTSVEGKWQASGKDATDNLNYVEVELIEEQDELATNEQTFTKEGF